MSPGQGVGGAVCRLVELCEELVDLLRASRGSVPLSADRLLTSAEVARELRWRESECKAWLAREKLWRPRPDGACRPRLYRWADVLARMPTEADRERSAPRFETRQRSARKLRRLD
jgi:hypothetical protein